MNREQKERLIEKIEYDIKSDMIAQEEKKKSNAANVLMVELIVNGAERIVNNMTDAEVIELLREIKRLKDYVKTLDNHNARIINQNRELQQQLRNLTKK